MLIFVLRLFFADKSECDRELCRIAASTTWTMDKLLDAELSIRKLWYRRALYPPPNTVRVIEPTLQAMGDLIETVLEHPHVQMYLHMSLKWEDHVFRVATFMVGYFEEGVGTFMLDGETYNFWSAVTFPIFVICISTTKQFKQKHNSLMLKRNSNC